MNLAIMIFFSLFNIAGLILWSKVSLVMLDIVICRDVRDFPFKVSILKVFSRRTCYAIRRFYQRFKRSIKNARFVAASLLLLGSYAAIFHRLSELATHITTVTELSRCIAAVCIPVGILITYRAFGFKISLL